MVKREKKPDICKIGTAAMVFRGEALQTAGGLKKDDLMMNPKGKVVSIRRSEVAKKKYDDKKSILVPKSRRDPAVYEAYIEARRASEEAARAARELIMQERDKKVLALLAAADKRTAQERKRDEEMAAARLAEDKAIAAAATFDEPSRDVLDADVEMPKMRRVRKKRETKAPRKKRETKTSKRERLVEAAIDVIQAEGITDPASIDIVRQEVDSLVE